MLNLQQLTWTDLVTVAVVLIAVVAIIGWLLHQRMRVKEVELGAGPIKVKFDPDTSNKNDAQASNQSTPPANPAASVRISGNKAIGNNKIDVSRSSVDVSENTLVGKNDIEVSENSKSQTKK